MLGWLPEMSSAAPSPATFQNNSVNNWFALSFMPYSSKTLNTVRAYVSAVAGTLAGTDITCDLYDSTGTNGGPGASVEAGKVPSATITAAGFYTWIGFTTALTTNTVYWLVWKNVNATQASNNCTFRYVASLYLGAGYLMGSNASALRLAWGTATSTNAGSTYSRSGGQGCLRVGYSDSTYDGVTANNATAPASGDRVYSTRESGVKFTSPSNAILNVCGISMMYAAVTSTPTGNPRYGLWFGGASPTLQGYTVAFPSGPTNFSGTGTAAGQFASNIQIPAGTIVRVTLAEDSNADASTKAYNLFEFAMDTDSNSTPLLPWNGTATKTYFDGSTWADSALGTSLFGHALLLDTAGEFGGGTVVSSPFPGGVW